MSEGAQRLFVTRLSDQPHPDFGTPQAEPGIDVYDTSVIPPTRVATLGTGGSLSSLVIDRYSQNLYWQDEFKVYTSPSTVTDVDSVRKILDLSLDSASFIPIRLSIDQDSRRIYFLVAARAEYVRQLGLGDLGITFLIYADLNDATANTTPRWKYLNLGSYLYTAAAWSEGYLYMLGSSVYNHNLGSAFIVKSPLSNATEETELTSAGLIVAGQPIPQEPDLSILLDEEQLPSLIGVEHVSAGLAGFGELQVWKNRIYTNVHAAVFSASQHTPQSLIASMNTSGQDYTLLDAYPIFRNPQDYAKAVSFSFSDINYNQNPVNKFDINNDGKVTPLDVLTIINAINRDGARALTLNDNLNGTVFLDANGDGMLTALDVLTVVNHINGVLGGAAGEGEAEGESDVSPIYDFFSSKLPIGSIIGSVNPRACAENADGDRCFDLLVDRPGLGQGRYTVLLQPDGTSRLVESPTDGWDIYDATPAGAQIRKIWPNDLGYPIIRVQGDKTNNGYRLRQPGGISFNEKTKSVIRWQMKYNEQFTIYVGLSTNKGYRYITYTNAATDTLGTGTYIISSEIQVTPTLGPGPGRELRLYY